MDTFIAIESRRSVKRFDPNHRMTDLEQKQLLQLAMLSPTSFNIQNWRFVLVDDPALRAQMRAIAWDQAQVTDASMFIVLCADVKAWDRAPGRYWRNVTPELQQYYADAIRGYFGGRDQLQHDEAMRSCGMAAQTLMLAARAMGYDSCPMGGFDFDAMAKLVNLPPDHVVAMALAVGKPLEPARPRSGQLAMEEVVIRNRF